ncbi:MAG: hypothetical protein ACHQQS_07445 [Thermoanaerobaculales bacterium]
MREPRTWLELLQAVQAGVTIGAILIGGLWTYLLFVRRRQRFPRAAVAHRVAFEPVDDGKLVLRATVAIANKSDVLLSIKHGKVWLQRVMPWPEVASDAPIESDKAEVKTELEWPVLAERRLDDSKGRWEVEPGETEEYHFDFLLKPPLEAVLLYSYFQNSKKRLGPRLRRPWSLFREIGWNTTTLHLLNNATRITSEVQHDDQQASGTAKESTLHQDRHAD